MTAHPSSQLARANLRERPRLGGATPPLASGTRDPADSERTALLLWIICGWPGPARCIDSYCKYKHSPVVLANASFYTVLKGRPVPEVIDLWSEIESLFDDWPEDDGTEEEGRQEP